jgi:thioesterase domain-containing protein
MTISSKTSPIYLLAGIYGEKSDFEEFRQKLPSNIPVEIIELQSIEEPVAQLTDMKAIGVALAREIDRLSPEGCLRLAGFSFGGAAVFEAARYLIDSGRSICFLGIIDGARPQAQSIPNHSRTARLHQLLGNINATRHEGFIGFTYRLVRFSYRILRELLGRFCSLDARLGYVRSLVNRLSPTPATFIRRMLLFYFRMKAMETWQPIPIHGPVFIAISEEYWSWRCPWKSLCPQARFVQLPGRHVCVLEPPSVEVLCSEFTKAVQNTDYRDTLS